MLLLTFLALLFTDRLTAMGRRDTSCISNVAQANNRHLYSVSGPYFTFSFHFSDMYVREVWLVTVVNQNARRQMILTIHQSERKCVINLCHHQCLIQSALFINFSFFFRVRKRKKRNMAGPPDEFQQLLHKKKNYYCCCCLFVLFSSLFFSVLLFNGNFSRQRVS